MDAQKIVVLKLGGDVVADPRVMRTMVKVVKRHHQSGGVVIVVSAPRGATPILRARVAAQEESDQISREIDFLKLMSDWMVSMNCEPPDRRRVEDSIAGFFIGDKKKGSPCPAPDQILALGEIHSASIVSGFLERDGLSVGVARVWERGMLTDDRFGCAQPLPEADPFLREGIMSFLENDRIVVVPGFVGHTADGQITTLGRSGSDLTATFVARALGAQTVEVWKRDVLHTADPRIFTHALPILFLSLDQAAELAAHGMAALHPAAMEPLRGTKAVVYVKSVGAPHLKGTRISSGGGGSRCAGITLSPDHVLYTARTGAMVDAIGSLRAASSALNEMGYPVGLTASGQTSFTLSASAANMETAAVQERILDRCGGETEVAFRTGCTILTIVGGNRGITPRILASITAALARARIPVISISMAASLRLDSYPTSCQVVVADRRGKDALSVVHVALYGKPPKRTRKRKS